ncbi:unnamed protein product [Pieris brassicae]|uniref:Uncharacterized protein n=1 Tax=Pieris brassicae TaxID=7116 RepID=A0A9P0TBG7_PIEBR|nr:unnamed protein product [Pieris brassicae]
MLIHDEFGEKSVSVLLDGEESELIFIDHPSTEMSVENCLSTYEPHACVVVYSVVAKSSFTRAAELLAYLAREQFTCDRTVVLVGNKADLARARQVTTNEGKALATSRDSKFIETSSGIQHNVDELLVGILKQIRLKESREKKQAKKIGKQPVEVSASGVALGILPKGPKPTNKGIIFEANSYRWSAIWAIGSSEI